MAQEIRLNEQQFYSLIRESVENILKEYGDEPATRYLRGRAFGKKSYEKGDLEGSDEYGINTDPDSKTGMKDQLRYYELRDNGKKDQADQQDWEMRERFRQRKMNPNRISMDDVHAHVEQD